MKRLYNTNSFLKSKEGEEFTTREKTAGPNTLMIIASQCQIAKENKCLSAVHNMIKEFWESRAISKSKGQS